MGWIIVGIVAVLLLPVGYVVAISRIEENPYD